MSARGGDGGTVHVARERWAETGSAAVPTTTPASTASPGQTERGRSSQSSHIDQRGGNPSDQPGAETICGLARARNETVLRKLRENGVEAYAGSVRYVRAVRAAGPRRGVASSSANCAEALAPAAVYDLFEERIGDVTVEADLAGKPALDAYLAAARALGADPDQAAVFEDALSGVEAGRAGGFVVGVDRVGQAHAQRAHGADTVVTDLAELLGRP